MRETPWEMKRQRVEKPTGDEELREIKRGGGERVGDEKVKKMRERERVSEKEDKMKLTFMGKEIMTLWCLEE